MTSALLEQVGFHPPAREGGASPCVHHLFDQQAERTPDAIALVDPQGAHLTYEALRRRSNQLAHRLRAAGIGPDRRVGLCLPRRVELVAGMLGVLKAGGAYVPLDPDYPAERLNYVIADSGLRILIRDGAAVPMTVPPDVLALDVDRDVLVVDKYPVSDPIVPVDARSLAYVIYTSGSTGRPKGVAVPHAALTNHMLWMAEALPLDAADRVLQKTSIGFDASVWEFYAPLLAGAGLVLGPPDVQRDPGELLRVIRSERISVVQMVPTLLRLLIDDATLGECVSLRRLCCGGEALAQALVDRAGQLLPALEIQNLYGPTETCVDVTSHACFVGAPGTVAPIGSPIPNVRCYVLDGRMRPVPVGETGELYVGGAALARGYLDRPALTAGAFVADPCGDAGGRLYRTGDRARWTAAGDLEYLGRADDQVKIRGIRVEVGEVESALRRHPLVRECAVVACGEPTEKYLVAHVVPAAGERVSVDALRESLRRELPEHMVPAVFNWLDDLPLTASGKLDRRALPAPTLADVEQLRPPYVAPRTHEERAVAAAWEAVLGVSSVGLNDNFFDLGGHSLRAIRIATHLARTLGSSPPLRSLLQAQTVADVAALIVAQPAPSSKAPAIGRASRESPVPAAYAQEAVWFLHQIDQNLKAYNFQATFRLRGPLDVSALTRALQEIVRRHEIFRTSFVPVDGGAVQQIHQEWIVSVPQTDLGEMSASDRDARLIELRQKEFDRPIDLTKLPLIRWHLVRLDQNEHELLHVEHHFVHDGWSFGIFLTELKALYEAFASGLSASLPEPALQFADFAAWQRHWLASADGQAQLEFWQRRLAETPFVLDLPTDRPRPPVFSHRGDAVRYDLPAELAHRARRLARQERKTLYVTTLAIFEALMYRYSGQARFAVGISLANRRREEVQGTIGMLVNMVPLPADLSEEPSFRTLISSVHEELLRAQEHEDAPFEKIVERLKPPRVLSHNLVFQTSFNFHDSPMPEFRLGGVELVPTEAHNIGCTKFDLHVMVVPRAEQRKGATDEVLCIWEYSTDIFDRATIERMTEHFHMLLGGACDDPDRRVSDVPLVTAGERQQILEHFNATSRSYPAGTCAHHLFEAQAARTPDADAVVFGEQRVTYAELDEQATRLARFLRRNGVGPDERVGICLERGFDTIVGVLGVLKAGAAYVPLDPSYPVQRLTHMLSDSQLAVLLTQRSLSSQLPRHVRTVHLDEERSAIAMERANALRVDVSSAGLAYMIYTSGSTGRPKGIAMPHGPLVNLIEWHRERFPAPRRTLQFAPLSFDASFHEMFATWATGGVLVLIAEDTRKNPVTLLRVLRDARIEKVILPVTMLHQLAEQSGEETDTTLSALRDVFATGEQLKITPAVKRMFDGLPQCALHNHYGPSETHVVTALTLDGPSDAWKAHPPIGTPIANTQIDVLDRAMNPTPIGIPGDLYISGLSVARGYWQQPGRTAERFVADPFSRAPGERMYATGDLARWRPDGHLEFLGRRDDQVKVRGFRVELGEVEAELRQHDAVSDAVVVLREDARDDQRLVAYVVPKNDDEALVQQLRAHLRERLPEYMVPAAFVMLERLPIGPTGKVERRDLPAPEERSGVETRCVAARTPTEAVLLGLWGDVLRVTSIGVTDNFFDLGGHSLMATRLCTRIRAVFDTEISLPVIFRHPTVEALAEELRKQCGEAAESIASAFLEFQRTAQAGR